MHFRWIKEWIDYWIEWSLLLFMAHPVLIRLLYFIVIFLNFGNQITVPLTWPNPLSIYSLYGNVWIGDAKLQSVIGEAEEINAVIWCLSRDSLDFICWICVFYCCSIWTIQFHWEKERNCPVHSDIVVELRPEFRTTECQLLFLIYFVGVQLTEEEEDAEDEDDGVWQFYDIWLGVDLFPLY